MKIQYSFYKYHKTLLILAGKWHAKIENPLLNVLYNAYAVLLYYFSFVMTQNILASIIIFRKCPLRVIELCCYYVQYTNVLIMNYLSKEEKMTEVLNYILNTETREFSKPDVDSYEHFSKINKRSMFIIFSLTLSAAIPWYFVVFRLSLQESTDPNCPIFRGLNYQLWYAFDLYNKQFWIAKFADSFLFWCMFFSLTYTRVITVFLMVFVLGQVKLLQNKFKRIDSDSMYLVENKYMEYDQAVFETVTDCARKYDEVLKLMRLVNKACNKFVLIGFFSNSMELALFLMQVLLAKTILEAFQNSVVLFMTLTQLFLFLWYANGIKEESGNLANIIYNETEWLNYDSKSRKILILIMTRAQKRLTCHSAFIGDMTIDTFKAMIKLCYSITTFFKTAYL